MCNLDFFLALNAVLSIPSTVLFLLIGIILTVKTRCIQLRALPYFMHFIKKATISRNTQSSRVQTISSTRALFTAMATTIGMGNVVGPSLAIMVGGPGALFWLLVYPFFGAVTKFVEVTFGLYTRQTAADGAVLGGPAYYLRLVHPWLGVWYGFITIFLFTGWSALQSNTLASVLMHEGVPQWATGIGAALILFIVVYGGAKRIGAVTSKLVPLMFILYVSFSILILAKDITALLQALKLVSMCILAPAAPLGGFLGATIFQSMRSGIYRSVFITEAGLGTSAIAHSLADVQRPQDQGILAMFSVGADMILCLLSGLVTLVTGVWTKGGALDNTLIYQAFKLHAPVMGRLVLVVSIFLFVITTIIGNTFNGSQSFASFTKHKFVKVYIVIATLITFLGALAQVPLIWAIMDLFLALVAIPNLIGLLILAFKYPKILQM